MLSIRSSLAAGVAASLVAAGVGTAAVTQVASAPLPMLVSPALELSALVSALPAAAALPTPPGPIVLPVGNSAGDWIINGYNAIQPWVEYGVSLAAWAVSWLPWPIGLIGPQANILYGGWQPIGEALAYSAAYLLDRQFELIVPTLVNGVKTGITDLVQGEIQWILSFFPPLPPISFPGLAGATLARSAATTLPRSAATVQTAPVDTGVEADPPATDAPATDIPAAQAPVADTPVSESAVAEATAAEATVAEVPVAEVPVAGAAVDEAAPTSRAERGVTRGAARSVAASAASTPKPAAAEADETPVAKTPNTSRNGTAKPAAARAARSAR